MPRGRRHAAAGLCSVWGGLGDFYAAFSVRRQPWLPKHSSSDHCRRQPAILEDSPSQRGGSASGRVRTGRAGREVGACAGGGCGGGSESHELPPSLSLAVTSASQPFRPREIWGVRGEPWERPVALGSLSTPLRPCPPKRACYPPNSALSRIPGRRQRSSARGTRVGPAHSCHRLGGNRQGGIVATTPRTRTAHPSLAALALHERVCADEVEARRHVEDLE